MIDEVTIRRDGVSVSFTEPARDRKGWLDSYLVTLATIGLTASVRVANPPYGTDPSSFFAQLAENWRGWEGEVSWRSMESELDLVALSDSLGHITITVSVRPDAYQSAWQASVSVQVDAGQTDELHQKFVSFFGYIAQQCHEPGQP